MLAGQRAGLSFQGGGLLEVGREACACRGHTHVGPHSRFVGADGETRWAAGLPEDCGRVGAGVHGSPSPPSIPDSTPGLTPLCVLQLLRGHDGL